MNNSQAQLKHLKNLYALDLGTTKFVLATMRENPGSTDPCIESVMVPADGMRRGMLANLEQAKKALLSLLEIAEREFGQDITRVVVGVAGSHLQGQMTTVSSPIHSGSVSHIDIHNLVLKAEQQYDHPDRELLHAVPAGYRVDARETIDDPLGFSGKTLSCDFFLIDADKQYMKDIVDLCNACGLQVIRLYSEPFASASVTVPDSHKQLGVALADIGGGTTDGIVFKYGRPAAAFTVNVAGKLMTSDLAIGLNINLDDAEQLKLRFGIKPRQGDLCEVQDIRGNRRMISGEQVVPILLPRVHELGVMVAKELLAFRGGLGAGLLLTGGGAGVQGIAEYFHKGMGVPVSRAKPILAGRESLNTEAIHKSPHATKLATVIGLLNLELCRLDDLEKNRKLSWTNRYLGQFINWIKELS